VEAAVPTNKQCNARGSGSVSFCCVLCCANCCAARVAGCCGHSSRRYYST
jgi:hypothetical protein